MTPDETLSCSDFHTPKNAGSSCQQCVVASPASLFFSGRWHASRLVRRPLCAYGFDLGHRNGCCCLSSQTASLSAASADGVVDERKGRARNIAYVVRQLLPNVRALRVAEFRLVSSAIVLCTGPLAPLW